MFTEFLELFPRPVDGAEAGKGQSPMPLRPVQVGDFDAVIGWPVSEQATSDSVEQLAGMKAGKISQSIQSTHETVHDETSVKDHSFEKSQPDPPTKANGGAIRSTSRFRMALGAQLVPIDGESEEKVENNSFTPKKSRPRSSTFSQ